MPRAERHSRLQTASSGTSLYDEPNPLPALSSARDSQGCLGCRVRRKKCSGNADAGEPCKGCIDNQIRCDFYPGRASGWLSRSSHRLHLCQAMCALWYTFTKQAPRDMQLDLSQFHDPDLSTDLTPEEEEQFRVLKWQAHWATASKPSKPSKGARDGDGRSPKCDCGNVPLPTLINEPVSLERIIGLGVIDVVNTNSSHHQGGLSSLPVAAQPSGRRRRQRLSQVSPPPPRSGTSSPVSTQENSSQTTILLPPTRTSRQQHARQSHAYAPPEQGTCESPLGSSTDDAATIARVRPNPFVHRPSLTDSASAPVAVSLRRRDALAPSPRSPGQFTTEIASTFSRPHTTFGGVNDVDNGFYSPAIPSSVLGPHYPEYRLAQAPQQSLKEPEWSNHFRHSSAAPLSPNVVSSLRNLVGLPRTPQDLVRWRQENSTDGLNSASSSSSSASPSPPAPHARTIAPSLLHGSSSSPISAVDDLVSTFGYYRQPGAALPLQFARDGIAPHQQVTEPSRGLTVADSHFASAHRFYHGSPASFFAQDSDAGNPIAGRDIRLLSLEAPVPDEDFRE